MGGNFEPEQVAGFSRNTHLASGGKRTAAVQFAFQRVKDKYRSPSKPGQFILFSVVGLIRSGIWIPYLHESNRVKKNTMELLSIRLDLYMNLQQNLREERPSGGPVPKEEGRNRGRVPATEIVMQLEKLSRLKESGLLTDTEFDEAKRRILAVDESSM